MNPLIHAAVTLRFERIEQLDDALSPHVFRRELLPCEAAFLADNAFVAHRQRAGHPPSPLPDFYIGAHDAGLKAFSRPRPPPYLDPHVRKLFLVSGPQ